MPLQATSGAASYDGFGGGVAVVPNYIEDVFSTYLYDGNSSTQTITNGIDLSTKGGLVWAKSRNTANFHLLVDTVRGFNSEIYSNSTSAASTSGSDYTSWNTNGYSLGFISGNENVSGRSFVSWTFRKQPKFFDVVTYTGTGSARTVAHNLGSTPGCIIVKRTDAAIGWPVYHRGLTSLDFLLLDATSASSTAGSFWDDTNPTPTNFTVGSSNYTNASGGTYVAYLFAHDAGGFGLTGTDNVISCGSFTTDGSGNATVSVGYEPQWVLLKASSTSGNWEIDDTFRGMPVTGSIRDLIPNSSAAEGVGGALQPSATGFYTAGSLGGSTTYIYIAIRRGPMKVPTLGTSVFSPFVGDDNSTVTTGFPVDMILDNKRSGFSYNTLNVSRLTGINVLITSSTAAESPDLSPWWQNNTGYRLAALGSGVVAYAYQRAPGFFDEVCYTGTSVARTLAHNLTVAPELIIVKSRSTASQWPVYSLPTGNNYALRLETTGAVSGPDSGDWDATTPTASVFSLGQNGRVNSSGQTFIAYLFATCAGVSKVGSYTGTATTLQINCGFTGGARFVLIKRTDSTGDWYVWDSARGIVAGNDPYLLLNSTAAEVTSTDYVDTYSAGFEISSTAPAAINASGGSFIFFAVS